MSSSAPASVSYAQLGQLGLTSSEIQILRQHEQQVALQGRHDSGGGSTRGRPRNQTSNPSSRGASAASSQGGPQRLMVDLPSLSHLYRHFDDVMERITDRIDDLQDASDASIQASQERARVSEAEADIEIARYHRLNAQMDQLDRQIDAMKHIQSAIKTLILRMRDVSQRMEGGHTRRR